MSKKQIFVIGGGASGLVAAIMAARSGNASVTILEQNERPGKKILATGNGRCNLTNLDMKPERFHGTDPLFVTSALKQFGTEQTLSFFKELGFCPVDRQGWIYPRSLQASSVLELLLRETERLGIRIRTSTKVLGLSRKEGAKQILVSVEGWQYEADAVILCCGSKASAISGSDGSGYALAASVGHTLVEPLPALTGLKAAKTYAWGGVRTEARATLWIDGTSIASESGEVQLTDYGISGIPVFQLSSAAIRAFAEGKKVQVELDFFPEWTEEELSQELEERAQFATKKHPEGALVGLLPEKLIRVLLKEKTLTSACKHFRVTVRGYQPLEQAQVCSGGVATSEVSADTMESKRFPGLYFGGELLDIDGPCGGYNLQWAWSSGAVAGMHAASEGGESL